MCLAEVGFEIVRIIPKNISIKSDGRNLRLKGAIIIYINKLLLI